MRTCSSAPCWISIHALREEGDGGHRSPRARRPISIHALREEGDPIAANQNAIFNRFLSTPSARRATLRPAFIAYAFADFYPRPPRGGRQVVHNLLLQFVAISIHALREEGDHGPVHLSVCHALFLSTPSARRATCVTLSGHPDYHNFYPRPPRGGRLKLWGRSCRFHLISIHALREEGDVVRIQ